MQQDKEVRQWRGPDSGPGMAAWRPGRRGVWGLAALLVSLGLAGLVVGCNVLATAPPHEEPRWPTLPLAAVPSFMQGTLYERVRFSGTDPLMVYGYSLVVHLHDTGDCTAPTIVRDYLSKQIRVRGFQSAQSDRYADVGPEEIFNDKRIAIVLVEGAIPPGARAGQVFDIKVQALPMSHTTSLAHGRLYQTDLGIHGREDPDSVSADRQANVKGGDLFVNPAYAMAPDPVRGREGTKSSLLTATVLDGGVVQTDRPISMELRQPQLSTARLIEELMARRWGTPSPREAAALDRSLAVARAQDAEGGLVYIYVPWSYRGDWRHFVGVVSHMFLNDSPDFVFAKCRQLNAEARKPNAPLADISLCWEAMGQDAIGSFEPLIADPNPDVAFAAARAAAFCDSLPARHALMQIATDSSNHNQLDAVATLGALPVSPQVNQMLRSLLDSPKTTVRLAAYRILADQSSGRVVGGNDLDEMSRVTDEYGLVSLNVGDRFLLDIVPSSGTPMVYATTTGVPRIALFGHDLRLQPPVTYSAMGMRLTISSSDGTSLLSIFYRDPRKPQPVDLQVRNDMVSILAALGDPGMGDTEGCNFNFNDVVAIAKGLVDAHKVCGTNVDGGGALAGIFEIEHPRLTRDPWESVPMATDSGRPQGGGGSTVSRSDAKAASEE